MTRSGAWRSRISGITRGEPGPPGTADDVADEEDAHRRSLSAVAPTGRATDVRAPDRARPVAGGDLELAPYETGELVGGGAGAVASWTSNWSWRLVLLNALGRG